MWPNFSPNLALPKTYIKNFEQDPIGEKRIVEAS